MLNKKLAAIAGVVMAVAVQSTLSGAPMVPPSVAPTKSAAAKPTTSAKPATTPKKPAAASTKSSQEDALKKFKAAPDSAVVGTAGKRKVTKGEMMGILFDWMSPSTLDDYLNYTVVMDAVAKAGFKITQADLQKKIDAAQVPPGQTLAEALQRAKVPMARFLAGAKIQIGLDKLAEKEVNPTEAEYAEYLKASHILINSRVTSANATEDDKKKAEEAAKVKADKVLAELKAGKPFAEAAKEYSEDPASKENGGELNWFKKGEMVKEFSDAAAALKPGETSEPVKTFYGYHIIKLEKTGATATPAEKEELKQKIVPAKLQVKEREIFERLKKEANAINLLSPTLAAPPMVPSPGMGMTPPGGRTPTPRPTTAPPGTPRGNIRPNSGTPPTPPTGNTPPSTGAKPIVPPKTPPSN